MLEYSCQTWHFNVQNYLSDYVEEIQKCVLKMMLPSEGNREVRNNMNIPLLSERREKLCHVFFKNNKNNEKLHKFLPSKVLRNYDLRSKSNYRNFLCKTERFKNSFLPHM